MSWFSRTLRARRWRQMRWTLGAPRLSRLAGVTRVSAELAGSPVWFESRDVQLQPVAEAWASAALLPAMQHEMTVDVAVPVDGCWAENTRRLVPIFAGWWDLRPSYPFRLQEAPGGGAEVESGQCFTCGVDSFYTLLRSGEPVEHLVYVHGFDLGLREQARMLTFERSLRAVAAEMGRQLIVVKTNFRQQPLLASVSWNRLHGAGLAAVGHLLTGHLGRLIVAPSWVRRNPIAWGSHGSTDPLWSSSRLSLEHDETDLSRHERIRVVAGEPLVWNHLRVCWKPGAELNCSGCEKCLRTMAYLDECGQLGRFQVFDQRRSLAERIDQLSHVSAHLVPFWKELARAELSVGVPQAIRRLVERSERIGGASRNRRAA